MKDYSKMTKLILKSNKKNSVTQKNWPADITLGGMIRCISVGSGIAELQPWCDRHRVPSDKLRQTRDAARSVVAKFVLPTAPETSIVDESLITVVDNCITSGLYLYHSIQTNVGERRSAKEAMQKFIQINSRQQLVNCFYSEQKAIKTKMGLTFKEINFEMTLFES